MSETSGVQISTGSSVLLHIYCAIIKNKKTILNNG